ncbi:MAG: hypothetical protein ACRELC_02375, partial [Gemmatimonadota bacterium]
GELGALKRRAKGERKRLATAAFETEVRLARATDFEVFVEDLSRAVARVVAKHHDEDDGGRAFRVVLGTYPKARNETEQVGGDDPIDHEEEG